MVFSDGRVGVRYVNAESDWPRYGGPDDGDPSDLNLGSVGVLMLRKSAEEDSADPAPLSLLLLSGST